MIIRVIYPAENGRILLRTEEDWESDLEPRCINDDGCTSEFWVETKRPYFYFKPVLQSENAVHWSRGDNFLAIVTPGAALDVHPYFVEDTRCTVCELMPPLA
jgi:hypothetical protein